MECEGGENSWAQGMLQASFNEIIVKLGVTGSINHLRVSEATAQDNTANATFL